MKVTVQQDTVEAIRQGIEPVGQFEIDIDLQTLTPEQREIVAQSRGCSLPTTVVKGEVGELVAALQAVVERHARERAEEQAEQRRRDAQAQEDVQKPLERDDRAPYGIAYSVWKAPYVSEYGLSPEVLEKVRAHKRAAEAEAARLSAESLAAAQPQIDAAKAKEDAEKAEALRVECAKRLETGVVEIEFPRDNRRDWGEPWIAKLTSRNGRRPEYDFSQGSYDTASETLSVPCKPGEVIAYGQKNYRKASRTVHNVCKMLPDGRLVEA